MSDTQPQHDGPHPPNTTATATGFEDDEIRDIGDRIVRLTPERLAQLRAYTRRKLLADAEQEATR